MKFFTQRVNARRVDLYIDGKLRIITDSEEKAEAWGTYLTETDPKVKTRAYLETIPNWYWDRDDGAEFKEDLIRQIEAGQIEAALGHIEYAKARIEDWATD